MELLKLNLVFNLFKFYKKNSKNYVLKVIKDILKISCNTLKQVMISKFIALENGFTLNFESHESIFYFFI